MVRSISWNVLHDGSAAELVLASDFPATGRSIGGFADLIATMATNHSTWETNPPPLGDEIGMTGDDYTKRWFADLPCPDRPVRAVLGFCVGSVFAASIAERVADATGDRPPVIVFDPERPDADLLRRHYREVIAGLSGMLSPDERAEALRAAERTRETDGDLSSLAATLAGLLHDFGGPAFRRGGLDVIRTAELVGTFAAFLTYLAAADDIDSRAVWADAVAISSNTENNGMNGIAPADRAALVRREIPFDVPHGELLRDARVARTVADLLA
jgi:hypothetical protein